MISWRDRRRARQPGGGLHRGRSRGEEPADLGVGDHGEPRAGIARLEGADDQACCLKPRTHDQIISGGTAIRPSRCAAAHELRNVREPPFGTVAARAA